MASLLDRAYFLGVHFWPVVFCRHPVGIRSLHLPVGIRSAGRLFMHPAKISRPALYQFGKNHYRQKSKIRPLSLREKSALCTYAKNRKLTLYEFRKNHHITF